MHTHCIAHSWFSSFLTRAAGLTTGESCEPQDKCPDIIAVQEVYECGHWNTIKNALGKTHPHVARCGQGTHGQAACTGLPTAVVFGCGS